MTIFAGINVGWIGPKTQNFVPANISYTHIEHWNVSTLYHYHVQIAKFSTRKTSFKPKSQKNVPANNCHPKVHKLYTTSTHTV